MARRKRSRIVLLLVLALSSCFYVLQSQARNHRIWLEGYARTAPVCYQGQPRHELADVQFWPGGPGVRLWQEREITLFK